MDDFVEEPRPGHGSFMQVMCEDAEARTEPFDADVGRHCRSSKEHGAGHASDAHSAVGVHFSLLPRVRGGDAEQLAAGAEVVPQKRPADALVAKPPEPKLKRHAVEVPAPSPPQHVAQPTPAQPPPPAVPLRLPVPAPPATPAPPPQPTLPAPPAVGDAAQLAPARPADEAPTLPPQPIQPPAPPQPAMPAVGGVAQLAPTMPAVEAQTLPQQPKMPPAPPQPALPAAGDAAQLAPSTLAEQAVDEGLALVTETLDAIDDDEELEEPDWGDWESWEPTGQTGAQASYPLEPKGDEQEQAQQGGVAQPALPAPSLEEDELDWMLRFFCAARTTDTGVLRARSKDLLAQKIHIILEKRRRFLVARNLWERNILSIRDVTDILATWRTEFEEMPAQLQQIERDREKLKSTQCIHRRRSRFEQELRMGFYSPNLVKIILGVGKPDPRLWRKVEGLAAASGGAEQPARRPVGAAIRVKEAQAARNWMRRGQRVSEATYNRDGACGHCGWEGRHNLIECLYCGVFCCAFCMSASNWQSRQICWRCPALDCIDKPTRTPATCERCHGLGLPTAQMRMHLREQGMEITHRPFGPHCGAEWSQEVLRSLPVWANPYKQCAYCELWLCQGCAHSEVRACKGNCPTWAEAPTKRPKLSPEALERLWPLAVQWRSGSLQHQAWTQTVEADKEALHQHVGQSLAAQVLRS